MLPRKWGSIISGAKENIFNSDSNSLLLDLLDDLVVKHAAGFIIGERVSFVGGDRVSDIKILSAVGLNMPAPQGSAWLLNLFNITREEVRLRKLNVLLNSAVGMFTLVLEGNCAGDGF